MAFEPNRLRGHVISTANSTTTPLASGATFTGTWEDVTDYSCVATSILGSVSTNGNLYFDLSTDGGSTYTSVPSTVSDTTFCVPRILNVVETHYRIRYVNGSTAMTGTFSIQSKHSNAQPISLLSSADGTVRSETPVQVMKTIIAGKTHGGTFKNVPVDHDGHLATDVPLTAFGDLRTAELSPVFQTSFEYTVDNTEIGTSDNAVSGTTTQADAMCVVSTVGSTSGSHAQWRSAHNEKYRAGLGGLFRGTAMFSAGVSGTEQAIGLMDEDGVSASHKNGYAIGYNGTEFGFFNWSNDSLNFTAMTTWDDPLDGTGESGMTLDPTMLNVYFIEFQYLGAGAIKIWVESDLTGKMFAAHTIQYANSFTVPSCYNPNFHINLHIQNGQTTENITAKTASVAYFVEGKTKHTEVQQPHFSSDKVETTTVTSEVALFTIRNKTTYASKTNFIDIVLEHMTSAIEAGATNNLGFVKLVKNATLGGSPSYSDINATNSVVEIDTSGTTVTGGTNLVGSSLAGKNDKDSVNIKDFDFILSPGDTITFAGSSANSATIHADLLWKELF